MLRHMIIAVACAIAPLGGCAALGDVAGAVSGRSAATPDTGVLHGADVDVLAYAAVGAWRAVQSEAVRLVELEGTPPEVKAAIARADRIGTPLIIELSHLAESYGAIKSAGPAAADRRAVVGAEIESLLLKANTTIKDYAAEVATASTSDAGAKQ